MNSKYLFFLMAILFHIFLPRIPVQAQYLSDGYEVRYFSKDPKANGETDFKGESSTLDNEQRLKFLKYYADEVSSYYGDEGLNEEVVTDKEAMDFLGTIKPQPLPVVRKKINLEHWRWMSYRPGQHESTAWDIKKYKGAKDILVREGALSFRGDVQWKWDFSVQTWRYSMSWKVKFQEGSAPNSFSLLENSTGHVFAKIELHENRCYYYTGGERAVACELTPDSWHQFKIEADLSPTGDRQHYNLYVDGILAVDYVLSNKDVSQVNGFEVRASDGLVIDDLYGAGYHQTNEASKPYYPKTFLDENFDIKPSVEGWQRSSYDDTNWALTKLPLAQGSERYQGEDLYFRKKIKVEDFQNAYLQIETLDPGGEVWVNGKLVTVINDRYPIRLDITKYLNPFSENHLGLRVYHFYLNPAEGIEMAHSYLDRNIGWFAGRASLDLVGETFVNDAFLYTTSIKEGRANVHTKIDLEHTGTVAFEGRIGLKMGLWNQDGSAVMETVAEKSLQIGPGIDRSEIDFVMEHPALWSPESPSLYKVAVEVEDKNGVIIDDFVFTAGIRTVSQEGGTFHLNGKPAMLNGAQIMGFRGPIEHMITWLRCPPDWWVSKELLMVKEMNSNMLRMHVHGWREKAVGINDARYSEMADQMGIMLIQCPPAWIRTADWGQIDFDGYHKYIKELQNHPSIVMWEISNHPNTFRKLDAYESDLFCEACYRAVYPYDPSRLISFTSHIGHLHYGNDAGTIEVFTGDTIQPSDAWTAPMVTRGNQDATTGYGSEWSSLRKWPGAYRQGFLDSKERAYFNFEHQESIGQPNWKLCRGKPWFNLQSYEWGYDEGSVGKKLLQSEWRESQAWQAFSAYEAIKKQRKLDYDGFSWCCLHGGANAATYKKPIIDFLGYAKLACNIHKNAYQPVLAGSNNVDVVYGPDDAIIPMILNLGEGKRVKLTVEVKDHINGKLIDRKVYRSVSIPEGRTVTELESFKPEFNQEGLYFIQYLVDEM